MDAAPAETAWAWMLVGGFTGAQLLLAVLSLLVGQAYRERVLLLHAGAATLCALLVHLPAGQRTALASAAVLVLATVAVLQLRDLTAHVGSLRPQGRLLLAAAGLLGLLAMAAAWWPAPALAVGMALWLLAALVLTQRAWPHSQPWVLWLVPAHAALAAAALCLGWQGDATVAAGQADALLAGLLAAWSLATYLACVWRSRVLGEDRSRRAIAETLNPLTGLSTPVMLLQRVQAARALMRRYGHPGSLLLVHVDYLDRVAQRMGPEVAEAAALEAGTRIRDALGPGDVGARLSGSRFAVLSEGTPVDEAVARVATRIVSAGLRSNLAVLPDDFLYFRIVVAALPLGAASVPHLLTQMGQLLDADVARAGERRIRAIGASELAAPPPDSTILEPASEPST